MTTPEETKKALEPSAQEKALKAFEDWLNIPIDLRQPDAEAAYRLSNQKAAIRAALRQNSQGDVSVGKLAEQIYEWCACLPKEDAENQVRGVLGKLKAPQPDTGAEIATVDNAAALEELNNIFYYEVPVWISALKNPKLSDKAMRTIRAALTSRKAVDVEALKEECLIGLDVNVSPGCWINSTIDHLAAAGHLKSQTAQRPADHKLPGRPYTAGQSFIWLRNKIWEAEAKGIFLSNSLWTLEALHDVSEGLQLKPGDDKPAPAADDREA